LKLCFHQYIVLNGAGNAVQIRQATE